VCVCACVWVGGWVGGWDSQETMYYGASSAERCADMHREDGANFQRVPHCRAGPTNARTDPQTRNTRGTEGTRAHTRKMHARTRRCNASASDIAALSTAGSSPGSFLLPPPVTAAATFPRTSVALHTACRRTGGRDVQRAILLEKTHSNARGSVGARGEAIRVPAVIARCGCARALFWVHVAQVLMNASLSPAANAGSNNTLRRGPLSAGGRLSPLPSAGPLHMLRLLWPRCVRARTQPQPSPSAHAPRAILDV